MSKDEAFRQALASFSWFYRRRMAKNIGNGLGLNMLEKVAQRADSYWRWSNYYADKWSKS